jgi:hypothetical protein
MAIAKDIRKELREKSAKLSSSVFSFGNAIAK